MIIDAHQHVWRLGRGDYDWLTPDLQPIYRDFDAGEMQGVLDAAGVERTVLIQAAPTEAETDFLLELAAGSSAVAGVVGWTDLRDPRAPERIAARAAQPKFRGLRPMLQADPDARWILEPVAAPALDAMEGAGLSFDALIRTDQLPIVAQLAAARPGLAIVIDHAAKPPIASGELAGWRSLIADCARLPHVLCKVSGLLTEAGSRRADADLAPVVDHLLEVFGPDRLMWGSDWPLLNMAGDYSGWLEQARRVIGSDAAQAVFGRTAARFYRLEGG